MFRSDYALHKFIHQNRLFHISNYDTTDGLEEAENLELHAIMLAFWQQIEETRPLRIGRNSISFEHFARKYKMRQDRSFLPIGKFVKKNRYCL